MGKIINIDNGGTLTDFCVMDDSGVYYAKTLTTPFDLSRCFFEGIAKVSEKVYGEKDSTRLLRETDYVRYSTTQGTNAIVERKGPRLGLITNTKTSLGWINGGCENSGNLFESLVGDRVGFIDLSLPSDELEAAVVTTVNEVASLGATRIVISLSCDDFFEHERKLIRISQRKFPSHLLGAVPIVTASGLCVEHDLKNRTWTALFNAYLHPAMERFLYSADHRLKSSKTNNPLLIFRNDGGAARVAKTTAIKTYSSGPRGGMEGVKALAEHYAFDRVLSCDVGGTTTDIGLVENGDIRSRIKGDVEGVSIAFPLAEIKSEGVGGSSIIQVVDGEIVVGPQSVGAVPGPACFGLGGRDLTITDVAFLAGILSTETFFGGELQLNVDKSRDVLIAKIAEPLGIDEFEAINRALQAWEKRVVAGICNFADVYDSTVLAAFGGAGALLVTSLAENFGVNKVIIPGLAAVFSACGIGFSDLSHEYENIIARTDRESIEEKISGLKERARSDMFAEGVELEECEMLWRLQDSNAGPTNEIDDINLFAGSVSSRSAKSSVLLLKVVKRIKRHTFAEVGGETRVRAKATSDRRILGKNGEWIVVPVYRLEEQKPGAESSGPAIIEEEYFTGKIDQGWKFHITSNRDILIEKE